MDMFESEVKLGSPLDRVDGGYGPRGPTEQFQKGGSDLERRWWQMAAGPDPHFVVPEAAGEIGLRILEELLMPLEQMTEIQRLRRPEQAPQKASMVLGLPCVPQGFRGW